MSQVYVVLFKIDGINSTRVFSDIDKASAFIKTIDGYKTVFIETIDRGMNELDNKCDNAVGCCHDYCGLCKDFPTAKDRKNCLAYKEKAKLVRRSMYDCGLRTHPIYQNEIQKHIEESKLPIPSLSVAEIVIDAKANEIEQIGKR